MVNREREPRLVRISQPSPASAAAKRQRRRRWLPVKAIAAILILTTAMIMMMRIFSWEDLFSCHRMLSPVFHPKQISHVGKPDQFQPISPIPRRDIVDQNHFFSNRTMLFFAISQASSFSSLLFHTNTLSNTNFSWTLFTLLEVAPYFLAMKITSLEIPITNLTIRPMFSALISSARTVQIALTSIFRTARKIHSEIQAQLLTHLSLFAPPRSRRGWNTFLSRKNPLYQFNFTQPTQQKRSRNSKLTSHAIFRPFTVAKSVQFTENRAGLLTANNNNDRHLHFFPFSSFTIRRARVKTRRAKSKESETRFLHMFFNCVRAMMTLVWHLSRSVICQDMKCCLLL